MQVRHWLAAAALGALSAQAFAQAPGGGPPPEMRAIFEAVQKSCADDMKTTCGGATGREGMMCLRQNRDKLKAPCREALEKMPRPPGGGQSGPPRG